ncbi:hypothetical protein ND894_17540 [Priestia megaterium]|uniref:hypothetical protein n=1 Tax=Priestia megaterium TaxID=1404 RepID=UPI0020766E26|nr:hypothetical protein [Priestia megaterium]USD13785.1 hypothetical protein ND894_17540 [Priestia megaterium]
MSGELIGILIGSLIALAGTFITSVVAIVMSKEQYKQELRKAFIQKKVDAYTHVCQVILAIKNDLLTKTVSSAELNWTAQSINKLADVCITEGLWIDEEDSKKLEVLQKQLSKPAVNEGIRKVKAKREFYFVKAIGKDRLSTGSIFLRLYKE